MTLPNDIDSKLKALKNKYKESAHKLERLETTLQDFKRKKARELKIRQEEVKISDPQLVKNYFNVYHKFNEVLAEIQKIQTDNAQYKEQINSKIMRYINGYGSVILNFLYALETLSKCENLENHGKCKDFFFQLGKKTCKRFLDMIAKENWGEENEGKSSNRKYFSEKTVEKTKDIEGIAKFFRDYFQLQTHNTSFFNNFFRIQEDDESKQEVLDQTETQSKKQSRHHRQQINGSSPESVGK